MADTATPLLDPTGTRGVKFADSGSVNGASPTTGRKKGALGGLTVYSSRWIMLALFCSATMTNAIIWISFAPISANAELFYGVGTLPINGLSMCFMLLYLPGSMLSSYLLERYGLRTGMVVGGAMGCISCWIRYASVAPHYGGYTRYAIVLFGQCIAALAQPIYTNAPAKLAGSWFPAKEREIATTIASILNPVGNAIGSVVPALMVQTPGDMGSMLLMEGILATVTFVPVALWFKSAYVWLCGCVVVAVAVAVWLWLWLWLWQWQWQWLWLWLCAGSFALLTITSRVTDPPHPPRCPPVAATCCARKA